MVSYLTSAAKASLKCLHDMDDLIWSRIARG